MAAEVRVPQMGESIVEATVARWLKQEGDAVSGGEPVLELETEKVNLEVPASQDGVLERIVKNEGDTVTVGDVLGIIGEGATPQRDGNNKNAPATSEAPVSQDLMTSDASASKEERETSEAETMAGVQATPLARSIAEQHGLDLGRIKGTGPAGRITREDVELSLARQLETRPAEKPASSPPPRREPAARPAPETPPRPAPQPSVDARPQPSSDRYEERVRLSRRRLTLARRLTDAHQTAVMTTTYNEIDMSAVMEARRRHRAAFKERHGVDLGFMSFFVKATVAVLKAFPNLNSELQDDELVLKYFYDMGIAIGAEEGLVVPVLRSVDKMSFADIEAGIADLVTRTRERKLTLEDLQGGTFTITNGGVFGSLMSTPILNPPQVGILGMHKIEERPMVREGQIVVLPMMYVALTYDHRVVDGREAVQFLVRLKELVEDPAEFLLEV
jgi:2-oxoglutarate dehydrogenase E2 component (dihydrolipoamide succinyltransferase)